MGIPSILKTDNGPPFNGHKFEEFCKYFGIKHRKITPYHPQADGTAEACMKNMARVIRSAIVDKKDWRQVLKSIFKTL